MQRILIPVLLIAAMLTSCGKGSKINFDVDVSNIKADVALERFDLDFDTLTPQNVYSALPAMTAKYGDFFDFYLGAIIHLPEVEDSEFQDGLEAFQKYCLENKIRDGVQKFFPGNESLEPLFDEGFRHFRYYFPNDSLPKIYTVCSGYQESLFPTDNIVAFALDKYLGANWPCYADNVLKIDNYKRQKMTKAMMPVDYFRTYAMLNYPKSDDIPDNLLTEMIYKGRIQYFLKSMMPSAPDSLLWGYSSVNYQWASAYEDEIWTYLVSKNLLFETNSLTIKNLTGEGPFTNVFGNASAPGAASFCGFGIVCSFVQRNPQVSLKQLMSISNLQDIYNQSRYNP
ncbi:MAG: hypothetical protein MJZ61_09680 [Bacteroidales bacterium]|nr:hypothetical protein [Bacteroidales bacterium]